VVRKLDAVAAQGSTTAAKLDVVAAQGNTIAAKLGAIATDLKEHRRDTEAHPSLYKVKEGGE
jgi:outer membrane murein-binding lipoprotein Lpp